MLKDYMCSSEASKPSSFIFQQKIGWQLQNQKLIKAQGMKATE